MKKVWYTCLALLLFGFGSSAYGQFSSNLQGTVQDTSGAVIPKASVTLTNTATDVSQHAVSGDRGGYRFSSLAPGGYRIAVTAEGFATQHLSFRLETDQTLNLPVKLGVAGSVQTVHVSSQGPVLDTADSRTQLTFGEKALESLPLPGRNALDLVTMAPGVVGLGMLSPNQNGQSNDNYAAETGVSASANGRSSVGNTYIVDGLDVTSDVTPGVLNLVPNPDTIQQVSVQVNTFTAVYGRSSSIVAVMTTKSGSSHFHGMASDYFTNQALSAGTEFVHHYAPYHSDNISATLSGPVVGLHHTYFFFGIEPLRSLTSTGNQVSTFEAPEFVAWAQKNYPNTVGTKLLTDYPASGATVTGVAKTAAQEFPGSCGTSATNNLPCSIPVYDTGVFNASDFRNGLQWNVRIDKYFRKDRVYGNYYDTTLHTGGPAVRVDMASPSNYSVHSVQFNETHTFSSNTLNEAAFGFLRMEGLVHPTGPFHVPVVSVQGMNTGIGVNKAHEEYVQHHYVWRDSLTRLYHNHTLQFGAEGFHGDNLTFFGPWFSQPNLTFTNLLNLVQDQPYSESGVAYMPLTGQPAGVHGGSFQFSGSTLGVYAQDNWRATRTLTLSYGLRWDDFGNPSPQNSTVLANFFMGPGETTNQQIANGYVKQVPHVFNHAITAFSPRFGAAWDIGGHGNWVLRGGVGMYHDWITLGNVQNEFTNPPAPVTATFITGTTTAPIFNLGTSDTFPFGFQYPAFSTLGLNDHGGFTGEQVNIAGNNPNLKASNTFIYTGSLAHALGQNFSASIGYSGEYSNDLFTGFGGRTTHAYYGFDINYFPGSLIQNGGKFVRLNQNFGQVFYTDNGPTSKYNAMIVAFKGRFAGHGFINASYTRSSSWDDAGGYPTVNYKQYWAPSIWNAPNRFSMTASYQLPSMRNAEQLLRPIVNGWQVSEVTILQSGTPYTVATNAPFKPIFNSQGQVIGEAAGGGDYSASGHNLAYPDVPSFGYKTPTSRQAYLHGIFTASDFPVPAFGTNGNELVNRYQNPGYADTDFALLKNNHLYRNANLQLRFEFYNIFNRPNLGGVNGNLASSSFGRVTSQLNPRWIQLGAKISF